MSTGPEWKQERYRTRLCYWRCKRLLVQRLDVMQSAACQLPQVLSQPSLDHASFLLPGLKNQTISGTVSGDWALVWPCVKMHCSVFNLTTDGLCFKVQCSEAMTFYQLDRILYSNLPSRGKGWHISTNLANKTNVPCVVTLTIVPIFSNHFVKAH